MKNQKSKKHAANLDLSKAEIRKFVKELYSKNREALSKLAHE
jgi:hypothetical protein